MKFFMKNYLSNHETLPAGLAPPTACRQSFDGGAGGYTQRLRKPLMAEGKRTRQESS